MNDIIIIINNNNKCNNYNNHEYEYKDFHHVFILNLTRDRIREMKKLNDSIIADQITSK